MDESSIEVRIALAKVETRLSLVENLIIKTDQLEIRLRKLEEFRAWVLGAVALSGALGGILGTLLEALMSP